MLSLSFCQILPVVPFLLSIVLSGTVFDRLEMCEIMENLEEKERKYN